MITQARTAPGKLPWVVTLLLWGQATLSNSRDLVLPGNDIFLIVFFMLIWGNHPYTLKIPCYMDGYCTISEQIREIKMTRSNENSYKQVYEIALDFP